MTAHLQDLVLRTRQAELTRRLGIVRRIVGLVIEADGPDAAIGEICRIDADDGSPVVVAEVVALSRGSVTLMPHGPVLGLSVGCTVEATGRAATVPVGRQFLGRVVDAFGDPLDGGAAIAGGALRHVRPRPGNAMQRPRITDVIETGVRAIDTLLTLGRGQRVGLFAGSGVGKSTLLGMIARHARCDVGVIALIGERGREVRDFVESHMSESARSHTVVVAAPADQPAMVRVRAAHAAVTIAEHFRDQGLHVMLTLDSLTRFAMARREVGLSAGEPPTARGYTPSVFAELPELCERCGTTASGGSITALMSVLVEGDDPNEPLADSLRALLDGHIVLSRALAQQAHFPAIDVLQSTSRVMSDIVSEDALRTAHEARATLALLERNRPLVEIGAYAAGANASLDQALRVEPRLMSFLRQPDGGASREAALRELAEIMESGR